MVPSKAGVIAQLRLFADAHGVSLTQLSPAWLMRLPGGAIPLFGTANPDHIAEATATDLRLERDDWCEVMVIARGRPMPWRQRPYIYTKERCSFSCGRATAQ